MSEPDIFISYSREDRSTAHLFADRLAEEGFAVWWDAALHSGETFDEVIERNLRAAKAVVVLWSPRSVTSRWVRAEATLADRRGSLAPAIIEPCDRPIIFELTHTAELSHWSGEREDRVWSQFVSDLRRLVGKEIAPPPARNDAVANPPASAFPSFAAAPTPEPEQEYEQTQLVGYADLAINQAERHMLEPLTDIEPIDAVEVGPLGLRIGRTSPADVVLNHPAVSRNHCEITLRNGELLVIDLNSTNGTFIDGERVEGTQPLPVGSVLKIGVVQLVHELRAPVAAR